MCNLLNLSNTLITKKFPKIIFVKNYLWVFFWSGWVCKVCMYTASVIIVSSYLNDLAVTKILHSGPSHRGLFINFYMFCVLLLLSLYAVSHFETVHHLHMLFILWHHRWGQNVCINKGQECWQTGLVHLLLIFVKWAIQNGCHSQVLYIQSLKSLIFYLDCNFFQVHHISQAGKNLDLIWESIW